MSELLGRGSGVFTYDDCIFRILILLTKAQFDEDTTLVRLIAVSDVKPFHLHKVNVEEV